MCKNDGSDGIILIDRLSDSVVIRMTADSIRQHMTGIRCSPIQGDKTIIQEVGVMDTITSA